MSLDLVKLIITSIHQSLTSKYTFCWWGVLSHVCWKSSTILSLTPVFTDGIFSLQWLSLWPSSMMSCIIISILQFHSTGALKRHGKVLILLNINKSSENLGTIYMRKHKQGLLFSFTSGPTLILSALHSTGFLSLRDMNAQAWNSLIKDPIVLLTQHRRPGNAV